MKNFTQNSTQLISSPSIDKNYLKNNRKYITMLEKFIMTENNAIRGGGKETKYKGGKLLKGGGET